jgi:hypothetical protein
VLLCHADNTSTVERALALNTGLVQPWPDVGAGVPRLVQFLADDGENTSFAVHYPEAAQARLLAQNSTGAFVHLRALRSDDDRDWVHAAEAVRATTGGGGGELLFLPSVHPRVAEFFADGSARAWQLRACFEHEMYTHAVYAQTHAHAALFAQANCRAAHQLMDPNAGCENAMDTKATDFEFYVLGDLGYVKVTQCDTHKQLFVPAEQRFVFNNSSPLRKLCSQGVTCAYGSHAAAANSTQCVCRLGFYVDRELGGCKPCQPGNFSDVTEAEACTPCPLETAFSHRASTSARSCFSAYGITGPDAGVLRELNALADMVPPTADTVSVHREPQVEFNATMAELRGRFGA